MSVLKKDIPGGTLILLAMVIIPIVWLFTTHETDDVKRDKALAGFIAQIPKAGTLGRWHDDLGSKSYGDATIQFQPKTGATRQPESVAMEPERISFWFDWVIKAMSSRSIMTNSVPATLLRPPGLSFTTRMDTSAPQS
ncbi:hypothetical protein N5D61_13825 [Pseudomonas sp. GD03842]|uniref:hypothetical protein n=1 Tax=Pseudomonas sp. GD03842 TaxID=2975385 RepID=UPI00244908B9|nr:hypothetical protein [Pseudomonas sp. GD03842]MDH0747422.1 hypothetical protein [Pseudomonas sp. GD03842]